MTHHTISSNQTIGVQVILGVDFGGVIATQIAGGKSSGTSFIRENFLATPPLPYVFDSLSRLRKEKFGDNIDIVSKCSQNTEALSLEWLDYYNFYALTGISRKRVFFRRNRADKAACVARRRHTHFIDNHPGVLGLMDSVACRILQGATEEDMRAEAEQLHKFTFITSGWKETTRALLGS